MTVLLTTVHDPDGKTLDVAKAALPDLAQLYNWHIIVEATDSTNELLLRRLALYSQINCTPAGDIAVARRSALKNGLQHFTGASHYHLVDFDRLLHWWLNYPDELRCIVELISQYEFVVIGRTRRALMTHPSIQRITEQAANQIFLFRTHYPFDVLTASRGISNRIARNILHQSKASGPAGIDCEWPLIAAQYCRVQYLSTEGLEYESDTFGIGRRGISEWQLRIKNLWDAGRACLSAEEFTDGR